MPPTRPHCQTLEEMRALRCQPADDCPMRAPQPCAPYAMPAPVCAPVCARGPNDCVRFWPMPQWCYYCRMHYRLVHYP